MKLLVVDDSNIMRRAITKYVSELSLDIVGSATNGKEALNIFKDTEPDMVTLDITMPHMDGLSCLDEMIKLNPAVKVLIVSALNDPATGFAALKKGAKGFVTKPFTSEALLTELKRIMEM